MALPGKINYLRISVTDRCNLRCVYCNSQGYDRCVVQHERLSFAEICRVVQLCVRCGITRIRLTGGEPLMRENLAHLVGLLSAIPGVEDLALTTNGILLEDLADELRRAGLRRINISLDALAGPCYQRLTGSNRRTQVLRGIARAIDVGLSPVRINCVVLRGVNLDQVVTMAALSLNRSVSVRFIEYYPVGKGLGSANWFVPTTEVRRRIETQLGPLAPVIVPHAEGPAVYVRAPGAQGTIGFISGRSSHFCHQCSRLRLTSDGTFRPCLHAVRGYDIKRLLRSDACDEKLLAFVQAVLSTKRSKAPLEPWTHAFSMQHIGG